MTDIFDTSWDSGFKSGSWICTKLCYPWNWKRNNLIFQMQISQIREYRLLSQSSSATEQQITKPQEKACRTKVVQFKLLPLDLHSLHHPTPQTTILFLGYIAFVWGTKHFTLFSENSLFIFSVVTTSKFCSLLLKIICSSFILPYIYIFVNQIFMECLFFSRYDTSILIWSHNTCERIPQNNKPLKMPFISWHYPSVGS